MALIHMNEIIPESLIDMEGDVKVIEERCRQNPNTSLFKISKEDHTLANLVRMKLHLDRHVRFAGYRVPHPTQHNIELRVQTASDGSNDPVPPPKRALDRAIGLCLDECELFERCFREAARTKGLQLEEMD